MIRIKKTLKRVLHHEHLLVYLISSIGAFILTYQFISTKMSILVTVMILVFLFLFFKKYKEHY